MKALQRRVYLTPASYRVRAAQSLNLLRALVTREIKGTYRRSLLGPAWAFLQPLFYLMIFSFIRGVLQIQSDGVPYVIFAYSALVPWTFFSNAVIRSGPSVYANAAIVKKVSVRREIFPLAAIVTCLVDFVLSSIVLIGMMVWFRVPVNGSLFWLPLLLLLTALLALGVGFGVAAVGTYKHDIIFAMPFLMQFWLLATPIMYPLGKVPDRWQSFYTLNPMVGIIEGFRTILVNGGTPDFRLLSVSVIGIGVIWLVAWPLFRYMSQYFADVL